MSGIGSSLTKPEDGTGLVNRTALAQLAGARKLLTRAEFDAAVLAERARISANSTGIYKTDEELVILGEVGTRLWTIGTGGSDAANAAASHAKRVRLPDGTIVTTGVDASVVSSVTAFPAGGADGDVAYNPASGVSYTRASGAWSSNAEVIISAAGARPFAASDFGKTLIVTATTGTVTFTNTNGVGFNGAAPIQIVHVGAAAVAYTFGAAFVDASGVQGGATLAQGQRTAVFPDPVTAGVLVLQG